MFAKKVTYLIFTFLCISNIALSQEVYEVEEVSLSDNDHITIVPFNVIDEAPVYPGCETYKTNEGLKKCMSEKISSEVTKSFKIPTDSITQNNRSARIIVQFRINKDGIVDNVRARSLTNTLEEEAVRVVTALPNMKPGKQKGKVVNVLYSLPIFFSLN